MARFIVTVDVTYRRKLTVYASSGDEAEEKAADIAKGWKDVHDAEPVESELE